MKLVRMLLTILGVILVAALLTVITQTGGIIYLLSFLFYPLINTRITNRWIRNGLKSFTFIGLYLISTFFLIPPLARAFGRVPLPIILNHHVQPTILFTALANRNYVKQSFERLFIK